MKTSSTDTETGLAPLPEEPSVRLSATTIDPSISVASSQYRDLQTENLRQLYHGLGKQIVHNIEIAISIGECVVEIVKSFEGMEGSKGSDRADWTTLVKAEVVPFAWVQALRYKKIFVYREGVRAWLADQGTDAQSVSIEAAYRLAGSLDPNSVEAPEPKPEPTGVVFGVSNEKLLKLKRSTEAEMERAEEELVKARAALVALKKTRAAIERTAAIVNQENSLKTATIEKEAIKTLSLVGKISEEVKEYNSLYQIAAQSRIKDVDGMKFGAYRTWLIDTYASDPKVLAKKLLAFCNNPKKAYSADGAFLDQLRKKNPQAQIKKVLGKVSAEGAVKILEFAEKVA